MTEITDEIEDMFWSCWGREARDDEAINVWFRRVMPPFVALIEAQARERALREAAEVARTLLVGKHMPVWTPMPHEIAEAILALLPAPATEPAHD